MKEESIRKQNIVFMLLSGLIVILSYITIIAVCKITPFGDETFLMYDMKRQYIDYYAYVKTLFSGENSILYSFATTLGSGMIGFEIYYLSSPFMFVFALCPADVLPIAVTIVIGVKLTLSAMIMFLFLRRSKLNDTNIVKLLLADIMSASWALSSFLFAHSMNMMWIDAIIILPLIIWALERMLDAYKERRSNQLCSGMVPYIICMAILLIFNYYIAYQIIIILCIWTIMYMFLNADKHIFAQIFRVIIASVVAAGLDAVLLLPTALELVNSPKDLGKLGFNYNGKNLMIRDVLSKLPVCSYDYIEARFGFPQIYCGVVLIFLTLLYFLCFRKNIKERLSRFIIFVILLVSFCHDKINLFWHAGMEPSGHPYRYAYMWIFLMVLCSYDVAVEFYDDSLCDKATNKKRLLWAIVRLALVIAIVGIIFYEVLRVRYDHISQMSIKLNWGLFVIYSAILLAVILFKTFGKKRLVVATMVVVAFAQMGEIVVNDSYTYSWQAMLNQNLSEYSSVRRNTNEAVEFIKDADKSFYRMENLNPRQQNDAMQYNYNGITHYSSAGLIYVRYFLQRLGFNDDNLLTHYGHDNTATADSLLGVKYILSDGKFTVHSAYESFYNGPIVSAFYNPFALPVAISTSGYDCSGISDGTNIADSKLPHVPDINPFVLQEDMYRRLLGREVQLFEKAKVDKTEDRADMPCDTYEITTTRDGELFMYVEGIRKYKQGLSVYVGDDWFSTYGNASCYKILNLGYHNAGENVVVKLIADSFDAHMGEGIFVTELTDNLSLVANECMAKGAKIDRISSAHLKISSKEGDGLFLSIPCDNGWKIWVDGKKVDVVAIYDSIMYIPLGASGEHLIDMRFIPEGLITGAIISLVSLMIFAAIIYQKMRKNKA